MKRGDKVIYSKDTTREYRFIRLGNGTMVEIEDPKTGFTCLVDGNDLSLDTQLTFDDLLNDPFISNTIEQANRPESETAFCLHQSSTTPMSITERGHTHHFYCVKCGEVLERFET